MWLRKANSPSLVTPLVNPPLETAAAAQLLAPGPPAPDPMGAGAQAHKLCTGLRDLCGGPMRTRLCHRVDVRP